MESLFLLPLGLIAVWIVSKLVSGTLRLILMLTLGAGIFLVLRDSVLLYSPQWLPWK